MNVQTPSTERDYLPIADHGLYACPAVEPVQQSDTYFSIGNLRTAALVNMCDQCLSTQSDVPCRSAWMALVCSYVRCANDTL